MSAAIESLAPANVVEAELNFSVPNGRRPQMFKPTPDHPDGRRTGDYELKTVPIADSRHLAERRQDFRFLQFNDLHTRKHERRTADFLNRLHK